MIGNGAIGTATGIKGNVNVRGATVEESTTNDPFCFGELGAAIEDCELNDVGTEFEPKSRNGLAEPIDPDATNGVSSEGIINNLNGRRGVSSKIGGACIVGMGRAPTCPGGMETPADETSTCIDRVGDFGSFNVIEFNIATTLCDF